MLARAIARRSERGGAPAWLTRASAAAREGACAPYRRQLRCAELASRQILQIDPNFQGC